MLSRGAELLFETLREDGEPSPRLHCEVLRASEDHVEIAFQDAAPPLWPGQRALAYFQSGDGLVRREARVWHVSSSGETCTLHLHGEVEEAPTREFYRIDAGKSRLWCTLAGRRCRVHTVSAGGLGVVSEGSHAVGEVLDLALDDPGGSAVGRVRVVNARALDGGVLYGLKVAAPVTGPSRLGDALSRLSTRLQLEALRRRNLR